MSAGEKSKKTRKQAREEMRAELAKLVLAGGDVNEIAVKKGVTRQRVHQRLVKDMPDDLLLSVLGSASREELLTALGSCHHSTRRLVAITVVALRDEREKAS